MGGVSGESEERVRDLFASALDTAPCVVFIDEVDAITPNRQTAQREMERRIVAQLITSLDGTFYDSFAFGKIMGSLHTTNFSWIGIN